MRSRATTLQPAMALVEEQISTTAFTPSISAVMQWSSPTQPGTECMVTPVISGPVVASEVATATFTRRGKVAMACLALPVNTVVFSVSVSRWSAYTGVLRKPLAPVCVSMPAVSASFCASAIRVTVCSTSKPPMAPLARCTLAPPSTAAALTCS